MIISPDFLDHWKTVALGNAIGPLEAQQSLIRLWGYCQTRKTWRDAFPAHMLAGICRFPGDPAHLRQSLIQCGFLDDLGEGLLEVHDWADTNANLITAWENGAKRKPAKPTGSPRDTHGTPTDNPKATRRGSDKIGVDKIREDKRGVEGAADALPAAARLFWSPEDGWTGLMDLQESLLKSFPGLDLDLIANTTDVWLRNNPKKAGNYKNWYGFLTNWIRREMANSPPAQPSGPAGTGEKKEGGPEHPKLVHAPPAGPWAAAWQHLYELPQLPDPSASHWASQPPALQHELRQALLAADPLQIAAWEAVEKKAGAPAAA